MLLPRRLYVQLFGHGICAPPIVVTGLVLGGLVRGTGVVVDAGKCVEDIRIMHDECVFDFCVAHSTCRHGKREARQREHSFRS
jgi:hypothetical protein